ncbi:hypothetical protein MMC25_004604 [Agyrium rufum]|nr:hypothetical protein [Agyrium rufum]
MAFRFHRFTSGNKPVRVHPQLRNLVTAPTRNSIFYTSHTRPHDVTLGLGHSVVLVYNPILPRDQPVCVMNLDSHQKYKSTPYGQDAIVPSRVTSLTSGYGILAVGGDTGEYAYQSLSAPLPDEVIPSDVKIDNTLSSKRTRAIIPTDGSKTTDTAASPPAYGPGAPFSSGQITLHPRHSTNHITIDRSRTSSSPHLTFSTNDSTIRTLDASTQTFLSTHTLSFPSNCTALSPCTRLRLIVGDSTNPIVIEADSGKEVTELAGFHTADGFACDWALDGHTLVTGAEDGRVVVSDARMWGRVVKVLNAGEIDCPRMVKFDRGSHTLGNLGWSSSSGGDAGEGGRQSRLLVAESADFVSVYDARGWEGRQKWEVWGEIGGLDWVGGGGGGEDDGLCGSDGGGGENGFVVGVSDGVVGGLMEFEKAGRGCRIGSSGGRWGGRGMDDEAIMAF